MKGFTLRLILKQRHKGTQKWPIVYMYIKTSQHPTLNEVAAVLTYQSYKTGQY